VRAQILRTIEFSVPDPVYGQGRQPRRRHLKHRAGLDVIDSTQAHAGFGLTHDEISDICMLYIIRLLAIC